MGGIDQEQLTAEEKEEQIIKTLNSNNPQAPHNLCQFSFKERLFKVDEQVDHLVFHICIDGNILMKENDDDYINQQDYWSAKKENDDILLKRMNALIEKKESDEYRKLPPYLNSIASAF